MTWTDASPVHSESPLLLVYTWCQLSLSPCERTWEKHCLANKSRWKEFPLLRVCSMKCQDELDARALEPIDQFLSQIPFHSGWTYCRRGLSIWEWCWGRGHWRLAEMAHRIGVSRSSSGAQALEYVGAISLEIWHLHCSRGCLINPRIWVLDILGACRWLEQWISRTSSSLPNWTLRFFSADSCFEAKPRISFQSNSARDRAKKSWASHSRPASQKQLASPACHSSQGWYTSNWKYME